MRFDVIALFPELLGSFRDTSLLGAALRRGDLSLHVHDLRDWACDRHRTVDDAPYGGGPGMVVKAEPLVAAIEAVAGPKGAERRARVLLMSPQGERLCQGMAWELARLPHLVLVCGRYEGVDQRAIDLAVDGEVSIGDYVLAGGELAAMVVIEAVARLRPGVVGNPDSTRDESFQGGILEGPHYTRPACFRGREVPAVLRSGDHAAVARWRAARALQRTRVRRPDLLAAAAEEEGEG